MGFVRETMGKFPWNERCKICGQYINEGEEFYIVFPPHNDKVLTWGIVHSKELDEISNGFTEEDVMEKLRHIKKPKFKGFTEEQKSKAEVFKKVCNERGFYNDTLSKRTLKMGKRGTSFKITYDMITSQIGSDYRGRKGLLDGLYTMQLESEIQHEFEKRLGLKPCKIVTAKSIIQKAIDDTDKLINRK